jgi:hypothetical protein
MNTVRRSAYIFTLLAAMSIHANDVSKETSKERTVKKLVAEMSTNDSRSHMLFDMLLTRIKDVENVIESPIDVTLALQVSYCSEAAAHPDDPSKYGKGVVYAKIKAEEAIKLCEVAYNNGGDKLGLVLVSLSRAYNKAENYSRSLGYAKQATELDYPFADVMMAIHYNFGDGVKKSEKEQFRWYKKAASKGVTSAMRVTANNYLDAIGTQANHDEAYFWSLRAIESKDGKGFYSLGKLLEKKAASHSQPKQLLQLAKQSYEVAKANFLDTRKDIARVNKLLLPNNIADDKVLFAKTIKGRKIDGTFYPTESNSNWYIGEKRLESEGNSYLYARTSYSNTILTLWYKHAANTQDSGWFADFFYAGNNEITEFTGMAVTSTINNTTEYVNIDLADPVVQQLPGTYRLSGRITYRDVLLLSNGKQVKLYYKTASKATPTYTMALNDPEINAGINVNQSANIILKQLTQQASQLNEQCCAGPKIAPLSENYKTIYKMCADKELTQSFSKDSIKLDCHIMFKTAHNSVSFMTNPFATFLENLLANIEKELE